jgi:class 3 adenylate cyclase
VEGVPETRYARADDGVYLAYQVLGDGDACFVGAPPIISNIETLWEHPEGARFLSAIGSFCRFVHYDKRGQGMSDRVAEVPTLERRAADTIAVMDAAGVDRAVVGGISEGGSTAAMVAATYPDRVTGVAMFGAFARMLEAPDYPIGWRREVFEVANQRWAAGWGTPDTLSVALVAPDRIGDRRFLDFVNRYERQSSTPSGLLAQLSWLRELDIRAILPVLDVPALVCHRTSDQLVPVAHGRWLGEHIAGARYVEFPGSEHVPWLGDNDEVIAEIEELVTGHRSGGRADRVLATVLFTDIVSSTEQATSMGDRQWHDLLDRHDAMARRIVARHGGRLVKATGDGLLATFDGPARGIRCATDLVHAAGQLDLAVRAGAHTGEVEVRGDDVAGIAVHIGSRVAAAATGGEVLVSRTVKDLVAGSGIAFEDRGEHELKGVPDRWQLYRVCPG